MSLKLIKKKQKQEWSLKKSRDYFSELRELLSIEFCILQQDLSLFHIYNLTNFRHCHGLHDHHRLYDFHHRWRFGHFSVCVTKFSIAFNSFDWSDESHFVNIDRRTFNVKFKCKICVIVVAVNRTVVAGIKWQ